MSNKLLTEQWPSFKKSYGLSKLSPKERQYFYETYIAGAIGAYIVICNILNNSDESNITQRMQTFREELLKEMDAIIVRVDKRAKDRE